jgi:hypothetical protein
MTTNKIYKANERWFSVRQGAELRAIYKANFLNQLLLKAARTYTNVDYARFHVEKIQKLFPASGIVDVIIVVHQPTKFSDKNSTLLINQSELTLEMVNIYRDATDAATDVNMRHLRPGQAFVSTDFQTRKVFLQSNFYKDLLKPADMDDAFSVSYMIPGHSDKRIANVFIQKRGTLFQEAIGRHEFEYANLPFLMGWLYKIDAISETTLANYLSLLSGLTPMQVAVLRELVGSYQYFPHKAAAKFEISVRTLETHFYTLHENALSVLGLEGSDVYRSSRLVDLCNHYQFLKFCAPVAEQCLHIR